MSEKAINKLLPVMEDQGLTYADAVAEIEEYGHHSDFRADAALDRLPYYGAILTRQVVGGDPSKPKENAVEHYGRLSNPTVHIGLNQVRRVVNRLIEVNGKPEQIVIELARDLKMNREDKENESKKIRENELANKPSLDVHRRIKLLLERAETVNVPAVWLRGVRAVEALERAGTPEARQALEKLARLAADPRRSQVTGGMIGDPLGNRAQRRSPEACTGEKLRNMPHLFRDGLRPAAVLV